jgi:tetratricopeptide (TPR) repeat protein
MGSSLKAVVLLVPLAVLACRAPAAPVPGPHQRPWSTEQEWLAEETVRDIAEMCAFARHAPEKDLQRLAVSVEPVQRGSELPPAFSVSVRFAGVPEAVDEQIEIQHSIWSPEDYAPLAARLLAARGLTPSPPAPRDDDRLLDALRDLRATVIQRHNLEVSKRLAADILSPDAHEAAALILGAFSLREASGYFWDLRATHCRMAAHLAMARALRAAPNSGLNGRFAEAVLATKSVRQAEAAERIEALSAQAGASAAQRSWLLALRLRNTTDWRLAERLDDPSLLERLEAFRARVLAFSLAKAVARFDKETPKQLTDVADWGRIAMELGADVDTGNRFAYSAVDAELAEMASVWTSFDGSGRPPRDWSSVLNAGHTRCISRDPRGRGAPQVLSWGTWAAFFQRHLCNQVDRTERHVRGSLGLPEEAKSAAQKNDTSFGSLDLYSFVRLRRTWAMRDASEYARTVADAAALARRAPQLVTFPKWYLLLDKPDFAARPTDLPDESTWFRPPLLRGVAYEAAFRLNNSTQLRHPPMSVVEELRRLAPYSTWVTSQYLEKKGNPPVDEQRAAYGRLLEYDTRAMKELVKDTDSEGLEPLDGPPLVLDVRQRLCALAADECIPLGNYFLSRGADEEAAAAFQKAFDEGENRVWVSNSCNWLVHHYLDHGEREKAERIAQEAAEVYSSGGLETWASVLERLGRLDEAESYYKKSAERYDSPAGLASFYRRQALEGGEKRYEAAFQKAIAKPFPNGLEKVDQQKLPRPPQDGVLIDGRSVLTRRYGIEKGDIIVGVDGWRVRDWQQYQIVRDFTRAPRIDLEVWHAGAYREVIAELPLRRFQVSMSAYRPPR